MPRQTFLTEKTALGIAIFIAGLCSIVYELLISTTSAYFLGDSITQFSLTIGFYMAAMGLGSYLSKWFDEDHLAAWFITTEGLLGLVGGASVPLLYYFFTRLSPNAYQGLVIGLTVIIGTLTGFEIPLLARIMKKYYPLRVNLANVMSLDYFGALLATLLLVALSGIATLGTEGEGPLAGTAIAAFLGEEGWEEVHEILTNLALVLVAVHIGGVVMESIFTHENLPKSMVTGIKHIHTEEKS